MADLLNRKKLVIIKHWMWFLVQAFVLTIVKTYLDLSIHDFRLEEVLFYTLGLPIHTKSESLIFRARNLSVVIWIMKIDEAFMKGLDVKALWGFGQDGSSTNEEKIESKKDEIKEEKRNLTN